MGIHEIDGGLKVSYEKITLAELTKVLKLGGEIELREAFFDSNDCIPTTKVVQDGKSLRKVSYIVFNQQLGTFVQVTDCYRVPNLDDYLYMMGGGNRDFFNSQTVCLLVDFPEEVDLEEFCIDDCNTVKVDSAFGCNFFRSEFLFGYGSKYIYRAINDRTGKVVKFAITDNPDFDLAAQFSKIERLREPTSAMRAGYAAAILALIAFAYDAYNNSNSVTQMDVSTIYGSNNTTELGYDSGEACYEEPGTFIKYPRVEN